MVLGSGERLFLDEGSQVGFIDWLDAASRSTGAAPEWGEASVLAVALVLDKAVGSRDSFVRQLPHHPSRCRNTQ
jgi:hypothetical protein